MPDYTGNFTNGKEYWLLNGQTCDFILTLNNKVNWYSTSISMKYMIFQDYFDGKGCRPIWKNPKIYTAST